MALTLAALGTGDDLAQAIQLGIEYDPQPPFDCGPPEKAEPELTELVRELDKAGPKHSPSGLRRSSCSDRSVGSQPRDAGGGDVGSARWRRGNNPRQTPAPTPAPGDGTPRP